MTGSLSTNISGYNYWLLSQSPPPAGALQHFTFQSPSKMILSTHSSVQSSSDSPHPSQGRMHVAAGQSLLPSWSYLPSTNPSSHMNISWVRFCTSNSTYRSRDSIVFFFLIHFEVNHLIIHFLKTRQLGRTFSKLINTSNFQVPHRKQKNKLFPNSSCLKKRLLKCPQGDFKRQLFSQVIQEQIRF